MTTERLTARTITDDDIRTLMDAAGLYGDDALLEICKRALAGRGGRGECAEVLNWGRAEAARALADEQGAA
jgi:hypothetical protein